MTYQTLETVFCDIPKHLEGGQKYSAARHIFSVFGNVVKLDLLLIVAVLC